VGDDARNLILGMAGNDTLKGGGGADELDGSVGHDDLQGEGGDDELFGRNGVDTLNGGAGADTLFGDEGGDLLQGGAGDDRLNGHGGDLMQGGAGRDTYFVTGGEVVDESVAGSDGIDTVESFFTFSLASQAVKGDVEILVLTGSANINGVGNALNNTLVGNSGANNLNGNSGADHMAGRGGDDSYVVNETGDIVDESFGGGGGIDRVLSFVSISLGGPKVLGAVENVRLALGTSPLKAAGNALANELVGNNGDNDLMGMHGNDELTGFGGKDTFVFNAPLDAATNVDLITDFTVTDDTIRLENRFMAGLPTGALAAASFHIGAAAADASDRIVYNDDTGALFFDADGTGAVAAVHFATLDANLPVSNADFLVV
jgi:Ca2+-binding RTX toxin-like protein